jgi:hypothetical protein
VSHLNSSYINFNEYFNAGNQICFISLSDKKPFEKALKRNGNKKDLDEVDIIVMTAWLWPAVLARKKWV